MNSAYIFFILLLIITFSTFTEAQNKKDITPRKLVDAILVEKNKPSVYITFERNGEAEPLFQGESNNRLWLRLWNNTKGSISFCYSKVDSKYGDVIIHYNIEENTKFGSNSSLVLMPPKMNQSPNIEETQELNKLLNGYGGGDSCLVYDLPSNKSVLFSIPKEHLINKSTDFHIEIQFTYEWEKEGSEIGSHPKHIVSFSFGNLPFSEQKKLSF